MGYQAMLQVQALHDELLGMCGTWIQFSAKKTSKGLWDKVSSRAGRTSLSGKSP